MTVQTFLIVMALIVAGTLVGSWIWWKVSDYWKRRVAMRKTKELIRRNANVFRNLS